MTCNTFTLTTVETSESVVLSFPVPNSLDNQLNKQLKPFNLWRDYKIHDEGISGQPLKLEGVEIGVAEGSVDAYGVCFPLCFPICFNQVVATTVTKSAAKVAQEKFGKIHNWIENNYTVTLNEFGSCFHGIYIIKDFTVESINHPSNYLWKLSLEKVSD